RATSSVQDSSRCCFGRAASGCGRRSETLGDTAPGRCDPHLIRPKRLTSSSASSDPRHVSTSHRMSTLQKAFVPDERTIFDWIETIFARGVRRPGYAADRWTENFCLERFHQFGLEQVRLEP